MTRCGGVVFVPGHDPACRGTMVSLGTWTYQGYGVVREFDIQMCGVCSHVEDHKLLSEDTRAHPIDRDTVRVLQRAEKARRDQLMRAAQDAVPWPSTREA